jgi:sterol desaturase/sphingolipid hydroxylase (fatty acid hydroxylase superfamily)
MDAMTAVPAALKWLAPTLLAIAMLEALWLQRRGTRYPWRETAITVAIALGQRVIALALGGGTLWLLQVVSAHRWWTIPTDSWLVWLSLFVAVEFTYYWFHRASHTCRWLWATHRVHHTPERMVLSGALRLGWTGPLSGGVLFFMPLVWLGFPPLSVLAMLGLNLLYQFWLHTEMIPRLGVVEAVFNTPTHHRVHHASNTPYLDANFGGVVIVFDRLFGTFVAERADEPIRYGLVTPVRSSNPFRIALGEWAQMARDVVHARSLRACLGHLFGPPGWRADGQGCTTGNLRRATASFPPSQG